jgi:uncharacterized membrane protein
MMKTYFFVFLTIILTVYGQIIIKARAIQHTTGSENISFLLKMFLDPWVISGLLAALSASATWMLAVQSANLSAIYPLMALTFVLVPLLAVFFFGEHLKLTFWFGVASIIIGISLTVL